MSEAAERQPGKTAPRFRIRGTRTVSRVPEILRLCHSKKVLHLGCADVPYTLHRGERLLHKLLAEVTSPDKLWGIDLDEKGVGLLREMGFGNVLHGDCEQMAEALKQESFDVVLAGEIIEHVENPGLFLGSIRSIMVPTTELLLTTPNASALKNFLHAMLGEEKVHEDHNYYFSYRTLKQLLERTGFSCEEIYYYQDIEGRGLALLLDRTLSAMTHLRPLWSDGLIVRAKALNATG